MNHYLHIALALIAAIVSLTACHDAKDLLEGLDRDTYQSYLHNQSGQDVTVQLRPATDSQQQSTYFIPNNGEVEIPDTERWHLAQRALPADSVIFVFADGTRLVHSFSTKGYGQSNQSYIYTPSLNNIFMTGIEVPNQDQTWSLTRVKANTFRYDYFIR